jgi:hypothetical protein
MMTPSLAERSFVREGATRVVASTIGRWMRDDVLLLSTCHSNKKDSRTVLQRRRRNCVTNFDFFTSKFTVVRQ